MTTCTFGPWTPHTGDECPAEPDAEVQVWVNGDTTRQAENREIVRAEIYNWRSGCEYPICFYRVCTPVEELWQVYTGRACCRTYDIDVRCGSIVEPADTLRISWPYTVIDGKRVIDDSRQPIMEKL